MNPLQWGWKCGKNNILLPIYTTADLIPEKFLKKFNCSCKTGCLKKCGCRKLGLKYSVFCKIYKNTNCINREADVEQNEDAIPEDEDATKADCSIIEPEITIDEPEED